MVCRPEDQGYRAQSRRDNFAPSRDRGSFAPSRDRGSFDSRPVYEAKPGQPLACSLLHFLFIIPQNLGLLGFVPASQDATCLLHMVGSVCIICNRCLACPDCPSLRLLTSVGPVMTAVSYQEGKKRVCCYGVVSYVVVETVSSVRRCVRASLTGYVGGCCR